MATVKLDPAKGVQFPNMTTSERDAISSPETGAQIWNTTTSTISQYNGSAWEDGGYSGKLNLTGGTMTGDILFADGEGISLGAGADLTLLSDGITVKFRGDDMRFQSADGTESYFNLDKDAGISLKYDNSTKIATTATGITVTGTVAATAVTGDGSALTGIAATVAALTDATVSASDPVKTSNVSAVGHLWINSTSGETYICIDATNNDNRFRNIGDGTGHINDSLGSETNPAASAGAIDAAGDWGGDGFYYITTGNGVKYTYCVKDSLGAYMVIGKFAADACETVRDTISTADVTIQDSTGTKWSCNFGDMVIDELRFIGVTSIEGDWTTNRNIDFIHGIGDKKLKAVMYQINNGPTVGGKYGYTCTYAKDGKGRWTNTSYVQHKISDNAVSVAEATFTSAGTFSLDNADDAKFTAHHTATHSGQDTNYTVGFGNDDNIIGFSDEYSSTAANMGGGRDHATSVYVLIRAA